MDPLQLADDLQKPIDALQTAASQIQEVQAALRKLPQPSPEYEPPTSLIDELPTNTNARYPFPDWNRPLSQIRWMTIHHSAGSRATQNIEWWHRHHTQNKSWSRVGYHFGIAAREQGGPIDLYQLNHLRTLSWHDSRNTDTFGVCFAGDLRAGHDVRPDGVQLDCFGRLVAWLFEEHDLPEWFAIVGHKRFGQTACPGDMDVWHQDLVNAAAKYGHDISGMISLRTSSLAKTMFPVAAFLRPLLGTDDEPSRADYDEHEGLGDV